MLSQRKPILAFIAVFSCAVFLAGPALAQEKSIVLAAATSAKDSGLFDHLLPPFTLKTGIAVNVVAVGTGQALDAATLMLCLHMQRLRSSSSLLRDMA